MFIRPAKASLGTACVWTIDECNGAAREVRPSDPSVRDDRGTNRVETLPFKAFAVTCGITFTFGRLRITAGQPQLVDSEKLPTALCAAGELVGGLRFGNYPGGSDLASGTLFGRIAVRAARATAAHKTRRPRVRYVIDATSIALPDPDARRPQAVIHVPEITT